MNPDDNYQVAGPATAKAPAYPHAWDPIVEREAANYNKMNQADPGDDIYLDPDLIKAQIRWSKVTIRRPTTQIPCR